MNLLFRMSVDELIVPLIAILKEASGCFSLTAAIPSSSSAIDL